MLAVSIFETVAGRRFPLVGALMVVAAVEGAPMTIGVPEACDDLEGRRFATDFFAVVVVSTVLLLVYRCSSALATFGIVLLESWRNVSSTLPDCCIDESANACAAVATMEVGSNVLVEGKEDLTVDEEEEADEVAASLA